MPSSFLVTLWDSYRHSAAAAKSLQSCLTLCDPIDGSPPGFPVPGILQARTLEWVAISFSNAWKWKVKVKSLSCVRLFATPWTAAYQAPLSMGFSRQKYWSGLPLPSPYRHSRDVKINQVWIYNFMWQINLNMIHIWRIYSWIENVLNCGVGEDLRVPWNARSNKSILPEISPEYSLEGLMLKLKLQHFGHLMQRTDSLEKTWMLAKIEGRRRRGK